MIERVREACYIKNPFRFEKDAYRNLLEKTLVRAWKKKMSVCPGEKVTAGKQRMERKKSSQSRCRLIPDLAYRKHPKLYSFVPEPVRMAFARTQRI